MIIHGYTNNQKPAPMTTHRIFLLLLLVSSPFVVSLAGASRAHADQEPCNQCKFLRCLQDTVAHKQQMIGMYQGLENFWRDRHLDERNRPVTVRKLAGMSEPERSEVYRTTLRQLAQYQTMETERSGRIPRPESCGYPTNTDLTVATDVFKTCATDRDQLAAASQAQPCKELAQAIAAHEAVHADKCNERKRADYWPYVVETARGSKTEYLPAEILTPAGKAAEEIAGYQREIDALNKIIEKLKEKCGKTSFKGVTIDCVIAAGPMRVRMGQKLSGHVCGDPVEAVWTINPVYFPASSADNNKPFENDCVAAGSALERERAAIYRRSRDSGGAGGWMCVYQAEPKPRITIRSFRLKQCEGPAEQTVTVDAEVSEHCDDQPPVRPPTPASPERPIS